MSTLKLKFLSDIHLEFSTFPVKDDGSELEADKNTILLVAGDTILTCVLDERRTDKNSKVVRSRFNRFLEAVTHFKEVYMIAGNHEAYGGGDVARHKDIVNDYVLRKGYTNIHFLEQDRIPLTKKVDLLAASLWTSMGNNGKSDPSILMQVARMMNDFRPGNCYINDSLFSTDDAAAIWTKTNAWLIEQLKDTKKEFVIMTHHLPSFQSIDPQFRGDVMNYGYASDMDELILSNPHIKHWIHGHTHFNVDYKIGETSIHGHMRGYPHGFTFDRASNLKNFKADRVIML
jgi:hypothetical protein